MRIEYSGNKNMVKLSEIKEGEVFRYCHNYYMKTSAASGYLVELSSGKIIYINDTIKVEPVSAKLVVEDYDNVKV